jgi:hypothetical protein
VKYHVKAFGLPIVLASVLGGCAVYPAGYGPAYDSSAYSQPVYPQPVYAAPPVYSVAPVYVAPPVFFSFGYRSGGGYRHRHRGYRY